MTANNFRKLTGIITALAMTAVCTGSVFGSVSITNSSGSKTEIKDGSKTSVVIEKRELSNGKIWSSIILNGVFIHKPSKTESRTINSAEERGEAESQEEIKGKDTDENIEYSEYVYEAVKLTNAERAKYGLTELKISENLTKAAREHAEDMSENNYFSHISSNGDTLEERVGDNSYICLGENIACGCSTAEEAVEGWMASEGHRENILSKDFTEIGIGYKNGYWVQTFGG